LPEVQLSAGPIEYEDTGGTGPVLVLIHGLVMDGRLWSEVVAELGDGYRCVLPTLPLGAHRRPMRPEADLSLRGLGRIITEFLERLDLRGVTLCFNDWGGAQLMVDDGLTDRVARLVLVSCEAFENYPPGIPGRMAAISGRLPGGLAMLPRILRVRRLRELPIVFGWMTRRGLSDELAAAWGKPMGQREIQRDVRKYMRGAKGYRREVLAANESLARFERPVLIVWAAEDRVMPPAHGRRLAELFPHSRLVEISGSYTLVPLDQPGPLAVALRDFVAG
jgi:pimeloyl-ACP methyl ester carboxylesterase